MKILSAVVLALSLTGTSLAQVAPGQAGDYTGTFKTKTVTTDSSLKDRSKTKVLCTISDDGSAVITSDDGMFISGDIVSGAQYGFFSFADEFTTGTGLWKFSKNGKIKASLQYGVRPGGDMVYSVTGNLNLKKVKVKAPKPRRQKNR
jgi:hypothetical protein